jgi:soluble lytic murein transglycosylase-like protein
MKSLRAFAVAVLLAGSSLAVQARETALLRNGFSIAHDHRQTLGTMTRLFTSGSDQEYVDIPTDNIAGFDHEDEIPKPSPAVTPQPLHQSQDLKSIVSQAAGQNQLDADFVAAVIRAESNGNARAVSRKGAQGLMQLMPATAAKLGVANSFDPAQNVAAGTRYLRELLARYNNDPLRALAAYNAGAGRVQQYGGVPPYRETRAYVAGIIRDFNRRKAAAQKAPASPGRTASQASSNPAQGD